MEMEMENHNGMHMKNKMWMWFHTTLDDTILFSNIIIKDIKGMILCCVIFFILSIAQEFLKYYRWRYEINRKSFSNLSYFKRLFSIDSGIRTILFTIQVTLSYIIMLVVMTFSIWLGLAIIIGTGIGYFIFGSRIHD
ncbi:Ctr copper transporter family-containing protein [Strongyloides ratti]|uniref:Copper transport protein n=1 Tax=Strongyloides ratti TaxID=34506 RepID=A0A090MZ73_STRRB|nr:Ctr copper transporter family-containing protein [Strongyloides ratti]CEF68434.1 Ctr copper transporter family-containing protein [Strongyloides ratti]